MSKLEETMKSINTGAEKISAQVFTSDLSYSFFLIYVIAWIIFCPLFYCRGSCSPPYSLRLTSMMFACILIQVRIFSVDILIFQNIYLPM